MILATQGRKLDYGMHVACCLVLKPLGSCRCPWSTRLAMQVGLCTYSLLLQMLRVYHNCALSMRVDEIGLLD